MKVSLKWLRDYTPVLLPVATLAERLTMAGLEVNSGWEQVGGGWENIVVGEIVDIERHPKADRLRLAGVDLGGERVTVVCGAPNLQIGAKVPFARVGAQLIDPHTGQAFQLKPARIRGVASAGMICSEKELGISDNHEGIMVLPEDAPRGVPLGDYLGDVILDIEVTPNRPDCLSIIGIAREVAALSGEKVRPPADHYQELAPAIGSLISVSIADPDRCRRYCASFIEGVKVGVSPPWMQERLLSYGMRPINNIVDITNYVMLEYGQPLHAFDYERIGGRAIIVRRAGSGEVITTLDGVKRSLAPEMLVIADARVPVALAGVMGGAGSEVTEGTTRILLESANFDMVNIRRTSRSLALRSEASLRFERGLSPELTIPAIRRATQLILEIAGGRAAKGIADAYPGRQEKAPIKLSAREVKRLLGVEMSVERMKEVLTWLGFECQPAIDSALEVQVPYWRTDISLAADLAEEIARTVGYDRIPTTIISGSLPQHEFTPALSLKERIRDMLVGCGLQEVITYSLTSRERIGAAPSLRVANPMSSEQEYLRTSLRPNLLATLSSNQKHEEGDIRLFEIGKVYLPQGNDLPQEREMLVGVLAGPRTAPSWLGDKGHLDFYDAKGVVETLVGRLGVEAKFRQEKEEGLHPGRAARIEIGGSGVGVVGELHPRIAEGIDLLPYPVALFEVEVEKLLPYVAMAGKYRPLPRFPDSVRDIAVVVDEDIPSVKIKEIIEDYPLVSRVALFDVYTGKQVPPCKKSLAFRVVYQSPTRTLTLAEVEKGEDEILARLSRELGATLRR